MKPHPDRLATTLAQRAALDPAAHEGPFQQPGPGSADARVDLKLWAYRAREALASRGTPAAAARLAALTGADLWAGTIRDGTARGVMLACEEAISLCAPAPPERTPTEDEQIAGAVFDGPTLRRKRDILVASKGARMRFSRKGGLLFVDRAHDLHAPQCMLFEDRADLGTLDGFEPQPGERPRLFSPGFLQPVWLEHNAVRDQLVLEGRLGRRTRGYPCRLAITGYKDEPCLRLTVAVHNAHEDHRLRIRFAGLDDAAIEVHGPAAWERVVHGGGTFRAFTLVRACGKLRVGDETVAVPGAQCRGRFEWQLTLAGQA